MPRMKMPLVADDTIVQEIFVFRFICYTCKRTFKSLIFKYLRYPHSLPADLTDNFNNMLLNAASKQTFIRNLITIGLQTCDSFL